MLIENKSCKIISKQLSSRNISANMFKTVNITKCVERLQADTNITACST